MDLIQVNKCLDKKIDSKYFTKKLDQNVSDPIFDKEIES